MSRKKKICLIAAVVILAAVVCLAFLVHQKQTARKKITESMSQTETVRVTRQNLVNSISVTGTIASADSRDVTAIAKNVEVLNVNYEEGDYVNAGDVIVVLDSTDLERSLTEAQNTQALSEYKENKSIETAAEDYDNAVTDGTDDYNKAVRNEADAKEALQEADADLNDAADALKRQEERLSAAKDALNAISPDDYEGGGDSEEYQNALAAAQKAVTEAQAEYTSRHQAYIAAEEADEKAQDAYETAAENLADAQTNNERNISTAADKLEETQMEHQYSNDSSEQTIENYRDQIASCTVTAPISGVITSMNVEVGDTYMGEGSVMFTVADERNFLVEASVDEYDISSIAKDMTAAVIVEALGEEEMPAAVSYVSPAATASNTGSSSYAIKVALDDENTDLRIGMTAKVSIALEAAYDVLTVPYDCVETDKDGNSVVYIDQNGEKTAVSVTVGMQGDYYVEISGEGLDENTMVYYTEPMVNTTGSDDRDNGGIMMMPGSGGGGRNSGGGPAGGGPGGF